MNIQGSSSAGTFNHEISREGEAERLRASQPAGQHPLPLLGRSMPGSGSLVGASSSSSRPQTANYSILWKRTSTEFLDPQARPLNEEEKNNLTTWAGKVYKSRASEYADSLKNSLEIDSQFRVNFFNILSNRKDSDNSRRINSNNFGANLDAVMAVEMARLGSPHNTDKMDFQDFFLMGIGLSRVKVFKENLSAINVSSSVSRDTVNLYLLSGIVSLYEKLKMPSPKLSTFFNDYGVVSLDLVEKRVMPVLKRRENMGEGAVLRQFLADWYPMRKYLSQASPNLLNILNSEPPKIGAERSQIYLSVINRLLGPASVTPFEEKLRDAGELNVGSAVIKELAKKTSKALDTGSVNPQWVHALYRWNLAHLAAAAGDSGLLLRLVKEGVILDDVDIRRANVAHFVAQGGHESIIEALKNQTQFPIDFNAQTKTGETPLHFAVATQSKTLIEALVGASGEINSKNRVDGCTPLARAAQLGKYKSILSLLNLGADKYIKNNQEQTPFEILKKYHKISTIVGEGKEARKALSLATPLRFDDELDV